MLGRKRTYQDSEGFVHNYADKSKDEKVFPESFQKTKKVRSEKSKKLLHDEAIKLRIEERKQINEMYAMLEKQGELIKQLVEKIEPKINTSIESSEGNFEEIKKEAKKISKDEGVVQHVNKVSDGVYKIDNFFDAEKTICSFENGLQL